MKHLTAKQRLRYYTILAGIAVAVPALMVVLCSVGTWNLAAGMGMAAIPSNFFVHFVFGLLFFRKEGDTKYAIATLVGFFSFFVLFPLIFFIKIFNSFWATLIGGYFLYIVVSALLWETIYWISQGVYELKNKANP